MEYVVFILKRGVKLKIIILYLFLLSHAFAEIDFGDIPPATNVDESKKFFSERKNIVIEQIANMELLPFPENIKDSVGTFSTRLLAKMLRATEQDIHDANKVLYRPDVFPWPVGTNIDVKVFSRAGDYDFLLHHLVRASYIDFRSGFKILKPHVRELLYERFLTEKGNDHYTHFYVFGTIPYEDTENHILMTETSRYLTNQLLFYQTGDSKYDNESNGFNRWMINHLSHFVKDGFSEFNSRPYEVFTLFALHNLYAFSWNKDVKVAAQIILDYVYTKFSVQSNRLRRSSPFRRQDKYLYESRLWRGDSLSAFLAPLVGNYELLVNINNKKEEQIAPISSQVSLISVSTDYRLPDELLNYLLERNGETFQRIHSKHGVEVYYKHELFDISAGGRYKNLWDFGTYQNDSWAVPLTLIPTHEKSFNRNDFIRFKGHRWKNYRNNLCVAPGFACGLNPVVPKSIPESCIEEVRDFKFFNFNSSQCSKKYGFYVALFEKKCHFLSCGLSAENFGFFEVRKADISYESFKSHVLSQKKKFYANRYNQYKTSNNFNVKFLPNPLSLNRYHIKSFGSNKFERNTKKWKFLNGNVLETIKDKVIKVSFPNSKIKYLLDLSSETPRRYQY